MGAFILLQHAFTHLNWRRYCNTFLGIFYQNDDSISSQLGTVKPNPVWEYVYQKLKEWASISDEEALQIARQLLFDILDADKENS